MKHLLFYSRFALYLLAVCIPLYYPGVVVAFDQVGYLAWFVLVPAMMFMAYYLRPPLLKFYGPLIALGLLLLFPLFTTGYNREGLFFFCVGGGVYLLTRIIFAGGSRGLSVAFLEVFVLGGLYYKLINYSRASEDFARNNEGWLFALIIIAIIAFFLHSMILYLAAFPDRTSGRKRKELAIFSLVILPICIFLAVLLPGDYIQNSFILNALNEQPKPSPLTGDDSLEPDGKGGREDESVELDNNGLPGGGGMSDASPRRDGDKKGQADRNKKGGDSKDQGGDSEIKEYRPDENRGPNNSQNKPDSKDKKGEGGKDDRQDTEDEKSGKGDKNRDEKKDKQGGQGQDKEDEKKDEKSGGGGSENKEDKNENSGGQGDKDEKNPENKDKGGADKDKPEDKNKNKDEKNQKNPPNSGSGGGAGNSSGNSENDQGGGGGSPDNQEDKNRDKQKDKKDKERDKQDQKDQKKEPPVHSVPSDQWDNLKEGEGGSQAAVMIIASEMQPVYAAETFWGDFDKESGFKIDKNYRFNKLRGSRLLEIWEDTNKYPPETRENLEIFYMSTLRERVVAYRPMRIEPTRLDVRYHPFELSYKAVSRINISGPREWELIPGLSDKEKESLAPYLKLDVSRKDRAVFQKLLKKAYKEDLVRRKKDEAERKKREKEKQDSLTKTIQSKGKVAPLDPAQAKDGPGYYDRIQAILRFFSAYQYAMGYDENTDVSRIKNFLNRGKTGDCTEFSHSAALLGRLAGIPSRVVTGYMVSKQDMNTPRRAAMKKLKKQIKPLEKFLDDHLYLVTSADHHAWVQYYMPGYGWVDFETTAYAKPPTAGGNPDSRGILIPDIQEEQNLALEEKKRDFPWRYVLYFLAIAIAGFVVLLYVYRFSRELYLLLRSRGDSPGALSALFTLLLMRLAVNGYPLKPLSQTPVEYSRKFPELENIAGIYTTLRYRERFAPGEKEDAWKTLNREYKELLKQAGQSDPVNFFRRIFSLKGLYY